MSSILSMTGFAQVSAPAGMFTLKSHNHRFLELHLSLPTAMGAMESDLRALLGEGIHRGKVYFSIAARPDDPVFRPRLNAAWLRELHAQWTALFPGATEPPGALLQPEAAFLPPDVPEETWKEGVRQGTRDVLKAFRRSRAEEGEKIVPSMLGSLEEINAILDRVGPRLEALRMEISARLKGQLTALLEERKPDPERLEQEAAVLCARMDPEEELVRAGQFAARLREHMVNPPVPAGKMLDFLVQELGRELQTLSQKIRDFPLREETVRLKMLCERLREQIQNIE